MKVFALIKDGKMKKRESPEAVVERYMNGELDMETYNKQFHEAMRYRPKWVFDSTVTKRMLKSIIADAMDMLKRIN